MTAMFNIYENHVNKFLLSDFCQSKSLAENTIELLGYGESDARIFDYVITGMKDCIATKIEKISYAYNNRKAIFDIMDTSIQDRDENLYEVLTEQLNTSNTCIKFTIAEVFDLVENGLTTDLPSSLVDAFWLEVANIAIKFIAEDYDQFGIDDVLSDMVS